MDFEGDGRHDLVVFVWRDEGLLEFSGRVMVFRGEPGGGFAEQATQVVALADPVFDFAEIVDLDSDGGAEILVPAARLGVFAFVRFVTTHNVTFRFHLLDGNGRDRLQVRQAAGRELTTRFSEDFSRAVFVFPDVDGDGIRDLVFGKGADTVCLHRGLRLASGGWSFDRKAWECVEDDPFARYRAGDVDGDGRDELLGFRFEGGRSSRVTVFRLGR